MRTKMVQGYYFFTIRFKRQTDDAYLADVYNFWKDSAYPNSYLRGLLDIYETEELIFCHVGKSSLPVAPDYHSAGNHLKSFERYRNRVRTLINKNNVYPIRYYAGNHGYSAIPTDFIRFISNASYLNLYESKIQISERNFYCTSCNAIPREECKTAKGTKTSFHAERKKLVNQPLQIGDNRTGNGIYYYFKENLYLSDSMESVTQFLSQTSEDGPEKTPNTRERIPDDVQIFVWNRDGGKCVKCGTNENLAFDHIIPFSKGGSNTKRNLQILCDSCNSKKGNKIGG